MDLKKTTEILRRPMTTHIKPGTRFKYVKGADVIARLNHAFEHMWSSEVLSVEEKHGHILAHIKLTVWIEGDTIIHEGFGSAPIMLHSKGKNEGKVVDIGNNYKSAYTNALKSAAKCFGVGLEVDESFFEDKAEVTTAPLSPRTEKPVAAAPTKVAPTSITNTGAGMKKRPTRLGANGKKPATKTAALVSPPSVSKYPAPDGTEMRTDVQLSACQSLSQRAKTGEAESITQAVEDCSKTSFDSLTKQEAVKVIQFLNTLPRG